MQISIISIGIAKAPWTISESKRISFVGSCVRIWELASTAFLKRVGTICELTICHTLAQTFPLTGVTIVSRSLAHFASLSSFIHFAITLVYVGWRALPGRESPGYRVIVNNTELIRDTMAWKMPQTLFSNWDLKLQLQSWNFFVNWKSRETYASYFGILSNSKSKLRKKFWLQSYPVTSVKEILCISPTNTKQYFMNLVQVLLHDEKRC